jgi:putative proteasome-type protease
MTYCIGVLLEQGALFASDSRTNAGLDNVAKFCKMTVFERKGERVLVLMSSGNLAGTQTVVSLLKQRSLLTDGTPNVWTGKTMLDVVMCISDVMRAVESRDAKRLQQSEVTFNASLLVGGQIRGEPHRRRAQSFIYAVGLRRVARLRIDPRQVLCLHQTTSRAKGER